MKKTQIIVAISIVHLLGINNCQAQDKIDSTTVFQGKQLIVPAAFIGYGLLSISFDQIHQWDKDFKQEVQKNVNRYTPVDNYLEFCPAISVYALNALGVKGKHDLKDRSIILATSYLITASFVLPLKYTTHRERPDHSNFQSFPSGHTATAFASAEFMRQEYKEVSPWYGVAGYTMAVGTGCLRIYNNKHWLSDVVAGAGFGILSTHIAYWIFPSVNKLLSKKDKQISSALALPYYNGQQVGMSLVMQLK